MWKRMFLLSLGVFIFVLSGCAVQKVMFSPPGMIVKKPDSRAVSHFVDGVILDLQQNYASALLSYQEALLYDSTSAAIHLAIGKDYLLLGKLQSGLIALKHSLTFNPDDIETRELLARVYTSQGKWELAEKTYWDILNQDSLYIDPYYNLALIYLQKENPERAAEMYRKILTLQPEPNPQVLLSLGELYLDLDQYGLAENIYYKLVEMDPQEGLGYYGVGLSREAVGDTVAAVEKYIRALQLDSRLGQARVRLNSIYKAQAKWDQALALIRDAVALDSTNIMDWLEIGEIYRQKGDSTLALSAFEDVAKRFPDDWQAHFEIGRFNLNRENYELALKEFIKVSELAPDTYWGWLFCGITLVGMDSLAASEFYLEKSLELAPDHPLGNYFLGTVYAEKNRTDLAISYLEKALELRPDWVAPMIPLAGVHETLQEYEISDSLFQKALELEPGNALLLNNYGYSLSQRGVRLDQAIEMALKALSINPESGAYLDTVGWIYFKMGEYEKALDYIQKAYSVRSESAEVVDHLGDVYYKLGFKEKASNFWKEALDMDQNNTNIQVKLQQLDEN